MNTKNLQAMGLLSALSLLSIHAQASPQQENIQNKQDKSMPTGLPAEHYKGTENAETDDFGQFVFSAEATESPNSQTVWEVTESGEMQECNLPPEILDATEETIPEGIVYEYEVDENGNYVMLDEEGNPVPIDEGFGVSMPSEEGVFPEITTEMTEDEDVTTRSIEKPTEDAQEGNWLRRFFSNLWGFFFGG